MKVIFMGTPEFAVATLDALLSSHHEVLAVVTVADKQAGRGKKLNTSAVKDFALSQGLPVLQPLKLKDPIFLSDLESFNAELFVVVAFRMLPESVWTMPPMGTINLHGSLLPSYRGAAPINWAVINGDSETGYSTFYINSEIDKGALLFQESMVIGPEEDAGSVHDRMMISGAQLVVKTLDAIEKGEVHPQEQAEVLITPSHAPKLDSENRRIDWSRSALEIHNLIRGLSPFPGAYCLLKSEKEELYVKIFKANVLDETRLEPGAWESDGKNYLHIGTGDKDLSILILQLPGKKKLGIKDLLNGWSFAPEITFS